MILKPSKKIVKEQFRFFNTIATGSGLGFTIAVPIVSGVIIGHYIDNKYNIAPFMTLLLLFLGMIVAFISIFRIFKNNI